MRNRNNDDCMEEVCESERPVRPMDDCDRPRPIQDLEEAPMSSKKARDINIQPMDFGFLVRVGCQSFAIESVDKLISNLNEYLKDPQKVEKSWFGGTLLM